jgi:hypothetical protein
MLGRPPEYINSASPFEPSLTLKSAVVPGSLNSIKDSVAVPVVSKRAPIVALLREVWIFVTGLAVPTPTFPPDKTKLLEPKFKPLGIDAALELIVKASPLASPSVAPPLAEKAPEADRVVKAPVEAVEAPTVVPLIEPPVIAMLDKFIEAAEAAAASAESEASSAKPLAAVAELAALVAEVAAAVAELLALVAEVEAAEAELLALVALVAAADAELLALVAEVAAALAELAALVA